MTGKEIERDIWWIRPGTAHFVFTGDEKQMAECYHFDCRPTLAKNEDFRTLRSQFNGTCAGCNEDFNVTDKIAYFPNADMSQGGSRPASRDEGASTGALERKIKLLGDQVHDLRCELASVVQDYKNALAKLERIIAGTQRPPAPPNPEMQKLAAKAMKTAELAAQKEQGIDCSPEKPPTQQQIAQTVFGNVEEVDFE